MYAKVVCSLLISALYPLTTLHAEELGLPADNDEAVAVCEDATVTVAEDLLIQSLADNFVATEALGGASALFADRSSLSHGATYGDSVIDKPPTSSPGHCKVASVGKKNSYSGVVAYPYAAGEPQKTCDKLLEKAKADGVLDRMRCPKIDPACHGKCPGEEQCLWNASDSEFKCVPETRKGNRGVRDIVIKKICYASCG